MKSYDSVLKNEEKAIFKLRELYENYGYQQYKMSKFEEYVMYVRNKEFLVSDNIITFTNTNGKLMALKPDVTISIIKNFDDTCGGIQKVYYNENVYRTSKGMDGYREIMQTGLECMGDIDDFNVCEVIMLAARSLYAISRNYLLEISHMGIVLGLLDELDISDVQKKRLLLCIGEKNADEVSMLCREWEINADIIEKLGIVIHAYGDMRTVLDKLRLISINKRIIDATNELERIYDILAEIGYDKNISFDFSVVNDMSYYSGIVFQGFVEGIPTGILSGGRYDHMMERAGKKSGAIGFAVYLDLLERLQKTDDGYDVDTILIYAQNENIQNVLSVVKKLSDAGHSVSALRNLPLTIKYRQILKLNGTEVQTVETDD